jgi:hypothetical protein
MSRRRRSRSGVGHVVNPAGVSQALREQSGMSTPIRATLWITSSPATTELTARRLPQGMSARVQALATSATSPTRPAVRPRCRTIRSRSQCAGRRGGSANAASSCAGVAIVKTNRSLGWGDYLRLAHQRDSRRTPAGRSARPRGGSPGGPQMTFSHKRNRRGGRVLPQCQRIRSSGGRSGFLWQV